MPGQIDMFGGSRVRTPDPDEPRFYIVATTHDGDIHPHAPAVEATVRGLAFGYDRANALRRRLHASLRECDERWQDIGDRRSRFHDVILNLEPADP